MNKPQPIPILLYHSVSDTPASHFRDWTIPVHAFSDQMAFLSANHYCTMSVTEMVKHITIPDNPIPEKTVVITFDDALEDFYNNAYPLLIKHKIPASLYVPTQFVGQSSPGRTSSGRESLPVMNWAQLNEVSNNGVECGGHSHNHVQLDLLSKAEAWSEITRCKEELEQHLERPIMSFAYPHGYHNKAVRYLVIKAGYTSACGVKNALSYAEDDPFSLARVTINGAMTIVDFEHVLQGRAHKFGPRNERLRTKIWRTARSVLIHIRK